MMMTGTGAISSCSNCEKVRSLANQLIVNMQDFEVFTMEMEIDLESALLKSQEVLSNFWKLIVSIKSITIVDKEDNEKELCESQTSLSPFVSEEKPHQVESGNEENEIEPVKSNTRHKMKSKMRKGQKPMLKPRPYSITMLKRFQDIEKADKLLRTIKCETPDGFYNLFECIKCQRQYNAVGNARIHVKVKHLKLGTPCPTCYQKYFDQRSLDLHIPKCCKGKAKQFKQIKIRSDENRKKSIKVHLHPHENQQQKQVHSVSTRSQNPVRKIRDQHAEKRRKSFDPLKVKVKNPFKNFSLEKSLNVKVVLEPLGKKMEKNAETSSISRTPTREMIEAETGKEEETKSSESTKN